MYELLSRNFCWFPDDDISIFSAGVNISRSRVKFAKGDTFRVTFLQRRQRFLRFSVEHVDESPAAD